MDGADAAPFRPGFDARWRSEEDFVLGITRDIWEDRNVHRLRGYYARGLVVRSPASVVVGNEGIVAATLATLAEFPDRELLGEDVIWCEAGPAAFLSSHRLWCSASHTGRGVYGRPGGRRLGYRILADCHCRANAVDDEWLVRDQGAIVRQLGQSPEDWTRALIAREGGPERCVQPMTPAGDVAGPYRGEGVAGEWGARLADLLSAALADPDRAVASGWDRAAELAYAGGVAGHGHTDATAHWRALAEAFPGAALHVRHRIGAETAMMPPRAAVRWEIRGRHDGAGRFGPASGAEVYVMGISHAEFGPRGLRREWTLIDETAVWKQVLLARGVL